MTVTAYPPHRIEVALEWAESCMSRADYMVAAVDGDRIEITHNQVTLARALYEIAGQGSPLGPALVGFVDIVEAMRRSPRSDAE